MTEAAATPKPPFREGDLLVVEEGCEMPRVCPVCGKPAPESRAVKIIFNAARGSNKAQHLVVDMMDKAAGSKFTRPVSVDFYLCDSHYMQRKLVLVIAVTAIAGSALAVPLLYVLMPKTAWPGVAVIPGILGVFVAAGLLSGRFNLWFKPKRFVDRRVWLKGAGRSFLDSLKACVALGLTLLAA